MDTLAKAFNEMMNAKKAGKEAYIAKPISNLLLSIFDIMKKEGYIDYKVEKGKFPKAIVTIKKLNKCRAIRPRFYVSRKNIDKYVRRYLPARDLGVIIISTNKGLITNREMEKENTGGCLLIYCF